MSGTNGFPMSPLATLKKGPLGLHAARVTLLLTALRTASFTVWFSTNSTVSLIALQDARSNLRRRRLPEHLSLGRDPEGWDHPVLRDKEE